MVDVRSRDGVCINLCLSHTYKHMRVHRQTIKYSQSCMCVHTHSLVNLSTGHEHWELLAVVLVILFDPDHPLSAILEGFFPVKGSIEISLPSPEISLLAMHRQSGECLWSYDKISSQIRTESSALLPMHTSSSTTSLGVDE